MSTAFMRPQAVKTAERRLTGTGVAPGLARGRPCFLAATAAGAAPGNEDGSPLADALAAVGARLARLERAARTRGDEASAELFAAHGLMLADPAVREALALAAQSREATGAAAEQAVQEVFDGYASEFADMEDDYLRERAADFTTLRDALLDALGARALTRSCREAAACTVDHCRLGNAHVLFGATLDAHVAARLDRHSRALVAGEGSARGHGALIARALGIPAVTGIDARGLDLDPQADVLVDGDAGLVVIDPSPATLAAYAPRLSGQRRGVTASAPVPGFSVMADLDRAAHVDDVLAAGAEGIGLYRTEFEMLAHGRLLDEDAQAARYASVLDAMSGAPVCIRLLDLGHDKCVPELELPANGSPALGLRGARLLEAHPALLEAQARAIVRAAAGRPVKVLYPMVASVTQFLALRERFVTSTAGLNGGPVSHGVMFELPSACVEASDLLGASDFGRVGSSDLTQYLFAVDRDSAGAAFDRHLEEPSLWSLLALLVRAAARARRPLSLCGAAAAEPAHAGRVLRAGFRAVSVEPRRVAAVRAAVRPRLDRAVRGIETGGPGLP